MDKQSVEENEEKLKENVEATSGEEVVGEADNVEVLDKQAEENSEENRDEFKEKYYYLAAEMENLKKRFQKEKDNLFKFGSEKILQDLVDVGDNLERVTMSLQNEEDPKIKNIVMGVDMVQKLFFEALEKHGLNEIKAEVGTDFDPYKHEAIAQEESSDFKEQQIVKVFQKGYELNGRVLRATKVVVAK